MSFVWEEWWRSGGLAMQSLHVLPVHGFSLGTLISSLSLKKMHWKQFSDYKLAFNCEYDRLLICPVCTLYPEISSVWLLWGPQLDETVLWIIVICFCYHRMAGKASTKETEKQKVTKLRLMKQRILIRSGLIGGEPLV